MKFFHKTNGTDYKSLEIDSHIYSYLTYNKIHFNSDLKDQSFQ